MKNVKNPGPTIRSTISFFLLLCILIFGNSSHAFSLQEITKDLSPAQGVIISHWAKGEWLVAFEPDSLVVPGDILTLLGDPVTVTHPETGASLKPIRPAEGRLRITQVSDEKVYAEAIDGIEPSRGDLVRRYSRLKALFRDFTEDGESLFVKLRSSLPELEWFPYELSQKDASETPSADIHFLHYSDHLEVRGPATELIRIYEKPTPPEKKEKDFASTKRHTRRVADLPVKALFSDFSEVGGKLLLAASDGNGIWIYQMRPEFGLICRVDLPIPTKIIALHWWQPAEEGAAYLAVTGAREQNRGYDVTSVKEIFGAIFRMEGKELIPVAEKSTLLLGTFDLNNDARRETLLGQELDRSRFFGRKAFQLSLKENVLDLEPFEKTLPQNFPVLSAAITNNGKGVPESTYIRRGKLWIAHGDEDLYRTDVGEGSLAAYTYVRNPGAIDTLFDTVSLAVPPVISDLDGDGDFEILAVSSVSSSWDLTGIGPGSASSQLIILQVENGEVHLEPVGRVYEGAIQGLAVLNGHIWITLTRAERSTIFSIAVAGTGKM